MPRAPTKTRKRVTRRKPKRKRSDEAKARSLLYKRIPMGSTLAIPKRKSVPMRYVQHVYLDGTASAGAMVKQYFRANSINDPDQTGSGHQPMMHDVFSGIYNHYSVKRSAIRVRFVPMGDLGVPVVVAVYLNDDNVTTIEWQAVCELSNPNEYAILGPTSNGSHNGATLVQEYDRDAIFKHGSDLHAGTNASFGNPVSEAQTFNLIAQNTDGSVTNWSSKISCFIEIVYLVDLTEPKDQIMN